MIISLSDSTRVDVDIGKGIVRSVAIHAGYAMIFDAKNLTHRGVGYNDVNLRIYLKFGVNKLSKTASGESEVVPQEVCRGCNKRISVQLKTHGEKCEKYHEIVLNYTNAEAKQRVAWFIQDNVRKNTNRNKMRKIERQRIKGEMAKKGSIIQENDDLLGYYHELNGSFRVISISLLQCNHPQIHQTSLSGVQLFALP